MGNNSSTTEGTFADRELEAAALKGNIGRVRLLVERDKANVNYTDEFGWSALLHAASEGQLEVIKYLVSKGASVTQLTADRAGALHHAITSQNNAVIAYLLHLDVCDVNGRNDGGWTPLHLASLADQQNAVKLLLARNADKTLLTNEGKTAAELAASPTLKSFILDYEILPENYKAPEDSPENPHKTRGMQESLQKLQIMQNPQRAPVEMKGYTYLVDDHGSSDDLLSIITTIDDSDQTQSSNNNNNNNNNSSSSSSSSRKDKAKSRELDGTDNDAARKRIFDAIHVLFDLSPEKLTLIQMQELIDFHEGQLKKYIEAKRILEEIRAREVDLWLAD